MLGWATFELIMIATAASCPRGDFDVAAKSVWTIASAGLLP